MKESEIESNPPFSPSIQKRLKKINNKSTPLNLEDAKFLTENKVDLHNYLKFTLDAYLYLMENDLFSLETLISIANFEQFKQLLFYHSQTLTVQSKILSHTYRTKQEEFHSLYYLVRNKEIVLYLYENGLDIHENFSDLCDTGYYYLFYDLFNIELITAEMFTQYLNKIDNFHGRFSIDETEDDILNFIEKILIHHNYFQLEQISLLYNIYRYTENKFLREYFENNLTFSILEQYFEKYLKKDVYSHYDHIIGLYVLYGFERLKMEGLIVHEKLMNCLKAEEDKYGVVYAELLYQYLLKLRKLNYPDMFGMKEKFLEFYEEKIRKKLDEKNLEIMRKEKEGEKYKKNFEKIVDFENIEDLKAYVRRHDISKMLPQDDTADYLKTYLILLDY